MITFSLCWLFSQLEVYNSGIFIFSFISDVIIFFFIAVMFKGWPK